MTTKELIKLENLKLKNAKEIHKMHMRELEYARQTNAIAHEKKLEVIRIKSAEIRRNQTMRKY